MLWLHLDIFTYITFILQLDYSDIWMKILVCMHPCFLPLQIVWVLGYQALSLCEWENHLIYLSWLIFFSHLILIEKNSCQMLAVFWHVISNDAKWPHGLMCPGVKQGCPDQPLTPGSFIRLCSRHGPIDKGQWKGRPLSLFTSIQLKHQTLNLCLVFIGTLIVFIDWHVAQLSVLWVTHNDAAVFSSQPTFCCQPGRKGL